MSAIAISYDEKTNLPWVATRIEWLAAAGVALAVESDLGSHTAAAQALFEQIVDLASPLYEGLCDMEDRPKRESAA
jgi:hypothetical protein